MRISRLILLLALLGAPACSSEQEPAAPAGSTGAARAGAQEAGPEAPILVFGVDGMEWSVILPLLHAGRLPNLRALLQAGSFGELATLIPTKSPRLWTTIATGQPPQAHGIGGFVIRPQAAGESLRQYTSRDRKVKAFWNILGDYDVASDTFGWWTTWPAEPVLGMMVAQTNTLANSRDNPKGSLLEGKPSQVFPLEAEALVFEALRASDRGLDAHMRTVFGEVGEQLDARRRERWDQCRWAFRADVTYVSVLERRLQQGPPAAVTSIYLGGADVAGHRFWAAYEPAAFGFEADAPEARAFGHIIPAYYVYLDQVLGRLLAHFPSERTVFVISDHGMHAEPELVAQGRAVDLEKFTGGHKDGAPGVLIAAGAGVRASGLDLERLTREALPAIGGIEDFCPTLLYLAGVPFGEDMSGRPLLALLEASLVRERPPSSLPTHDDAAWFASREARLDLEESGERLQQLRSLGYLGDDEQDE